MSNDSLAPQLNRSNIFSFYIKPSSSDPEEAVKSANDVNPDVGRRSNPKLCTKQLLVAFLCGTFLCGIGVLIGYLAAPLRSRTLVIRDTDESLVGSFDDNVEFSVTNTPVGEPNQVRINIAINGKRLHLELDQETNSMIFDGHNVSLSDAELHFVKYELLHAIVFDMNTTRPDLPACCFPDMITNGPEMALTLENGTIVSVSAPGLDQTDSIEEAEASAKNASSSTCECDKPVKEQRDLHKQLLLKTFELLSTAPSGPLGRRQYNLTMDDSSNTEESTSTSTGTQTRSLLQMSKYNWGHLRGTYQERIGKNSWRYGYWTQSTAWYHFGHSDTHGDWRGDGGNWYRWWVKVGSNGARSDCLGRCGGGCAKWWWPDDEYFQDCLDHDMCLEYNSGKYSNGASYESSGDHRGWDRNHCGGEWWEAVDDYLASTF